MFILYFFIPCLLLPNLLTGQPVIELASMVGSQGSVGTTDTKQAITKVSQAQIATHTHLDDGQNKIISRHQHGLRIRNTVEVIIKISINISNRIII